MKKLDRYIIREMIMPFMIGLFAVVMMFQANMLIALFKNLSLKSVPLSAVLQLVLFKTPNFLQLTFPVAMALASSLAISRIARESELTAMRSAGMPIRRIVRPILIAGIFVAIVNFLVTEKLMPPSEALARKRSSEVNLLALAPDFQSNVVLTLRNYTATFGSVSRTKTGAIFLNDVLLIERRGQELVTMITAKSGVYDNGNWTIKQPYLRVMQGQELLSASPQSELVIHEPISVPDFFSAPQQEEQSLSDLWKGIQQLKLRKADTRRQEVSLHSRFSVPAACLVFSLAGPVFAIWLARSGPFVGVFVTLLLVMLYYNAFVISTEIVGTYGWAPPWFAAWLPDIIFLGLGLWALRRIE